MLVTVCSNSWVSSKKAFRIFNLFPLSGVKQGRFLIIWANQEELFSITGINWRWKQMQLSQYTLYELLKTINTVQNMTASSRTIVTTHVYCKAPWDCRCLKRKPRIKLVYKYLLLLYWTYGRTLVGSFEGYGPRIRPNFSGLVWSGLVWSGVFIFSSLRTQRFRVMLRPTASRPVYIGTTHPSGANDQIFITVSQLRVCWCGAPSLTRGWVCVT
jgi:hypothetical protein